jgi:hypothetical protein
MMPFNASLVWQRLMAEDSTLTLFMAVPTIYGISLARDFLLQF